MTNNWKSLPAWFCVKNAVSTYALLSAVTRSEYLNFLRFCDSTIAPNHGVRWPLRGKDKFFRKVKYFRSMSAKLCTQKNGRNFSLFLWYKSTAVAQWLRCCATYPKVASSIPDCVIGIFHWHNPSDRIMALGLTQPLTEMSTRRIS
jgi:hypothetical protein